MDGIHDLGGMDGFGAVRVERGEPVFHSKWEGRVFGLLFSLAGTGVARVDGYRHSVERMDPAHYLSASYYERMMTGIATLLTEAGVLAREELEARAGGTFPLSRPVAAVALASETSSRSEPRFGLGEAVVVRHVNTRGHTRCPRYIRGRRGVVVRLDPRFRLPDVAAHVDGAPVEPTYSVRFTARELWGDGADAGASICVDLWESYLLPA